MSEAPKKIWIPLRDVPSLVDVSDGSIVKGPGPYYVRSDLVDWIFEAAGDKRYVREFLKGYFMEDDGGTLRLRANKRDTDHDKGAIAAYQRGVDLRDGMEVHRQRQAQE